mmetsp:Transcript_204/g.664  ORF Transcript_204/g.664 Transcript_204/m.664 type:complete len:254 (+) Transcript_204:598-1359(+)
MVKTQRLPMLCSWMMAGPTSQSWPWMMSKGPRPPSACSSALTKAWHMFSISQTKSELTPKETSWYATPQTRCSQVCACVERVKMCTSWPDLCSAPANSVTWGATPPAAMVWSDSHERKAIFRGRRPTTHSSEDSVQVSKRSPGRAAFALPSTSSNWPMPHSSSLRVARRSRMCSCASAACLRSKPKPPLDTETHKLGKGVKSSAIVVAPLFSSCTAELAIIRYKSADLLVRFSSIKYSSSSAASLGTHLPWSA